MKLDMKCIPHVVETVLAHLEIKKGSFLKFLILLQKCLDIKQLEKNSHASKYAL